MWWMFETTLRPSCFVDLGHLGDVDTWVIKVVVSNMFYFHPYLGKISNLTNIFSDGLKPPPSYPFWGD